MAFMRALKSTFFVDHRIDKVFLARIQITVAFSEPDESRKVTATLHERCEGFTTYMDIRPVLDSLPADMLQDIADTFDRVGFYIPRHLRPIEEALAANPNTDAVINVQDFTDYLEARHADGSFSFQVDHCA